MGDLNVICGCKFISDAYYRLDDNVWAIREDSYVFRVGILPTTQTLFGKIYSIRLKDIGTRLESDRPMAMIEARRFLGHVTTPFSSTIMDHNKALLSRPALAQEDPYGDGWLYRLRAEDIDEALCKLESWENVKQKAEELIAKKGITCFDVVPDFVYAAIGIDCSQVVMVLSDKVSEIPIGSVMHVIADYNPGSEIELQAWSVATGNEILEFRVEKKIAHALIRRLK